LHSINNLLQFGNFMERCTYHLHEGHYVVAQHSDDSVSIPPILNGGNRGFLNPSCASRHFPVMSTDIKNRVCYWFAIADLTTVLWYLQNCRILIGTRWSRTARPPATRTSPVTVITRLQSDMSDPGVLSRDPENEVSMYLMRLRVSQQKWTKSIIYNVHFTYDLYTLCFKWIW